MRTRGAPPNTEERSRAGRAAKRAAQSNYFWPFRDIRKMWSRVAKEVPLQHLKQATVWAGVGHPCLLEGGFFRSTATGTRITTKRLVATKPYKNSSLRKTSTFYILHKGDQPLKAAIRHLSGNSSSEDRGHSWAMMSSV
jgi:hypothetical protein